MKALFAFVLLYYFFGIQYLSGMSTAYGPQMTGLVNIVVITVLALLYYHFKTHQDSRVQVKSIGTNAYTWLRALTEKYLFVMTLVLFVLATVAQIFRPIDASYVGRFFAAWIICFVIVRDAFWQAKIYLGRHLFLHKESIFRLSVALTFLMIHRTQASAGIRSILIAIVVGELSYVLVIKRANVVRGYNIRKLFPTRLYTLAIIVSLLAVGAQYYPQTKNISFQTLWAKVTTVATSYRERTTQAVTTITDKTDDVDQIVTSEEVVGSGVLSDDTGSTIPNQMEEVIPLESSIDLQKQVTFTQALQHIFDAYQIPLSTATNIHFSKITTSDSRYALFKTAYEKRMLGSSVNPDAPVRCDVYMVMKGIAAGRNIATQGNVFDTYRAAAQANDEINGCERNGLVKGANL